MAGSLERNDHRFFESVANMASHNPLANNEIYLLEHNVNNVEEMKIIKRGDNLFTIQIPNIEASEIDRRVGPVKAKRMSYTDKVQSLKPHRFYWDPTKTELENYRSLDVEHVDAYFNQNDKFIDLLKSQEFDIGIGGAHLADSLLFRALGLNFIKLHEEDIEAFAMQFKFDMPVLLSSYPSSMVWSNFGYGELPHGDSHKYRWASMKSYLYHKLISRPLYMNRVKAVLPKQQHAALLNDYDQDHAMILAEGTKVGMLQAIMMKPPNVQPVYPLRDECQELMTLLDLDSKEAKGAVVIVNVDAFDPKSALFIKAHDFLIKLLDKIRTAQEAAPLKHSFIFLHDERAAYMLKNQLRLKPIANS
mmetsp:Transcript_13127/g.22177  ORF Transcript_13127/g.22177 Transcript_13127/m.22177 type:complete len:361 (+) Transcript_13127:58-1140(+)